MTSPPEIIRHKRGATLRIPRVFPDQPADWSFSAAVQLPDRTRLPFLCQVVDPDAFVTRDLPPSGYSLLYLELTPEQTADLPLRLLPCDYRAQIGTEVSVSETFYIQILPEVAQ